MLKEHRALGCVHADVDFMDLAALLSGEPRFRRRQLPVIAKAAMIFPRFPCLLSLSLYDRHVFCCVDFSYDSKTKHKRLSSEEDELQCSCSRSLCEVLAVCQLGPGVTSLVVLPEVGRGGGEGGGGGGGGAGVGLNYDFGVLRGRLSSQVRAGVSTPSS